MTEPPLFSPSIDEILTLDPSGSWPESKHRFDADSVWAVSTALAARRPLLIRGEPGIGKSQLARGVAQALQVPFLSYVIDERSERDDLLFEYDAVSRLAQAQLLSALGQGAPTEEGLSLEDCMSQSRFIRPGVLWWAIDWKNAKGQAKTYFGACPEPHKPTNWTPEATEKPCGAVVLVDEIDKADPSVPNGLLETLGNAGFHSPHLREPVALPKEARPPLVVITTNEERELPAAFLRRCLVLHMEFPSEAAAAQEFLLGRARVFWEPDVIDDSVLIEAAKLLEKDREIADGLGVAKPGAAEFLDLIRSLVEMYPGNRSSQSEALCQVQKFVLGKYCDS